MVVSEKKQVSCKHERKVSHKKKCCSKHSSTGNGSSERRPSMIPLSPIGEPAVSQNSNLDMSVDDVLSCPFREVCRYLRELDETQDSDLISETILHFSLRIHGLPECREEDLPLAVYLFIEDTFGIQSKIEFCFKLEEDPSVVGVVFETMLMKYNILKNDALLEGAEVRMTDNKDLKWIFRAMGIH